MTDGHGHAGQTEDGSATPQRSAPRFEFDSSFSGARDGRAEAWEGKILLPEAERPTQRIGCPSAWRRPRRPDGTLGLVLSLSLSEHGYQRGDRMRISSKKEKENRPDAPMWLVLIFYGMSACFAPASPRFLCVPSSILVSITKKQQVRATLYIPESTHPAPSNILVSTKHSYHFCQKQNTSRFPKHPCIPNKILKRHMKEPL